MNFKLSFRSAQTSYLEKVCQLSQNKEESSFMFTKADYYSLSVEQLEAVMANRSDSIVNQSCSIGNVIVSSQKQMDMIFTDSTFDDLNI